MIIANKNNNTNNKVYLITLIDGSDIVTNCLPLFLSSLVKSGNYQNFDGIFLLSPSYINSTQITDKFREFQELSILPITLEFQQPCDRYYVKLLIKDFLDLWYIDDDDQLLYLDYDHIFRNKLSLPYPESETILVSSDVKSTNDLLNNSNGKQDIQLPPHHYNTSLIMGRRTDLLLAMSTWAKYYDVFREYIPVRYLEEISFYGSALNAGLKLKPISDVIQGTWFSYQKSSKIFHFGGEYPEARVVKNHIIETMKNNPYTNFRLMISEQLLGFIEDKLTEGDV